MLLNIQTSLYILELDFRAEISNLKKIISNYGHYR
jgi:hypothetical protein